MFRKLHAHGLTVLAAFGFGAAGAGAQIDVSGSVDFYYQYNFNKENPSLRTFDIQHNSFTPSYAEVVLEKAASATSRVGGRVDLGFGPTADIVGSFEPGSDEVFKHLQQAYISVAAGDNLTVDVGKFVTPHGAEVIESQNNWNYSRSILFGYAIPFYHTGARVALTASDQLTFTGFLVNGMNNSTDNNADKTFGASVALTPNEQISWFGNFMAGKEGDADVDGDQDLLWLFDTTLSFAATDVLTLMANFDYGSATDYVATGTDATWWGIAAYARFQPQEDWALAGRFEYINDEDGGFMTLGQKAQSFTATSDHTVFEDLIARFEFRFDITDNNTVFTDADGNPTENQPSIGLGLVYELN